MFVICTYDVEEKRCVKVMKILRQYLFHIQNSVFEGELTPAQLEALKHKLMAVINEKEDKIQFYFTYNNKQVYKDYLGIITKSENIIS